MNYHSAAELILYGVGWQVATPSPDDVVYKSLVGTPEKPAIPGYRPQLYTTNGEADGHASNVNGVSMFTVHPRDVDLRDRVERRPERRLGSGGL